MSFFSYMQEIRNRLIYSLFSIILTFSTVYFHSEKFLYLLTKSFILLDFPNHRGFIFTDMTEALFTYFYMSFVITFLFSLPFLIYNIIGFLKPSFYEFDFSKIIKEIIFFFLFNTLSFWIFFCLIIPKVCLFFINFEQKNGAILLFLEARISSFLSFFLHFISLNFLLTFLMFFAILGIKKDYISFSAIKSLRQKFFFLSLLLSAVLSPPDIISQLSLTFLILLMYEILYFYSIFQKKKMDRINCTSDEFFMK